MNSGKLNNAQKEVVMKYIISQLQKEVIELKLKISQYETMFKKLKEIVERDSNERESNKREANERDIEQ